MSSRRKLVFDRAVEELTGASCASKLFDQGGRDVSVAIGFARLKPDLEALHRRVVSEAVQIGAGKGLPVRHEAKRPIPASWVS